MLAAEGVARLVKVELHHVTVVTADGLKAAFSRPRRDVLASTGAFVVDHALTVGEPVGVRVYLHVLGRARPMRLALSADGGNNSVDFDRDDPDTVIVKLGKKHGQFIVSAKTSLRHGKFGAQLSTDPVGPATWLDLPGNGKQRIVKGHASGALLWVRFRTLRGSNQSDWCAPVSVTVP